PMDVPQAELPALEDQEPEPLEAGDATETDLLHEPLTWTGTAPPAPAAVDAPPPLPADQPPGHRGEVTAIAFSPNGEQLATASWDKPVRLWDVITGQERATLRGHAGVVDAVAFAPDGQALASASWDKTVKVWDLAGGWERLTLAGHDGVVTTVAYAPDGRTLA